jgi:carboxylesterase type B
MSIRRVTFLLALALAACAPLAVWAQKPACTTGNVQTSSGPVCGKSYPVPIPNAGTFTANAYLGIPYAQAQRWQNPLPANPWTAFQATQFGNECPQPELCNPGDPPPSEDCLYLNVWTPTGATPSSKLPVLVFIHGGAFFMGTGGTSTADPYDGTYLAASQNVVVVTFNYRLGVLGFLATSDMQSGAGNFGFRDQIMALRWVRQNIASFGGDPSQVMLFGESAGAISVGLHAVSSPQSAGLFKAALMESNTLGLPYKTLQQAQEVGAAYRSLFPQCSNLECLQKAPVCELVAKESSPCLTPQNQAPLLNFFMHWTPVIDGSLITGQPLANAGNLKVPMLMGTNKDEGIFFAYRMAQSQAQPQSATICPNGSLIPPSDYTPVNGYVAVLDRLFGQNNSLQILQNQRYNCSTAPCTPQLANVITDYIFTCANRQFALQAGSARKLYMYLFTQVSSFNLWGPPNPIDVPACQGQVCHGDEIPYVFNTARALNKTFLPEEETLSQMIGGYWASFAKDQSPGNAWPLFTPNKAYLMLNEKSSTAIDPLNTTANCDSLWGNIGYQNSAAWGPPQKKPAH